MHRCLVKNCIFEKQFGFCRRAFVHEFALITKEHKWLQLATQRVLVKAPKFVLFAQRQLQLCGSSRLSVKHRRVADLLQKLQLALQHVQDDEVATRYRAIAGLLLMPHLLGDTVCYVYSICPVCLCTVFIVAIVGSTVALLVPFLDRPFS